MCVCECVCACVCACACPWELEEVNGTAAISTDKTKGERRCTPAAQKLRQKLLRVFSQIENSFTTRGTGRRGRPGPLILSPTFCTTDKHALRFSDVSGQNLELPCALSVAMVTDLQHQQRLVRQHMQQPPSSSAIATRRQVPCLKP